MRYLAFVVTLVLSSPAMAQPWFEAILSALDTCQQKAWQDCPEPLACFQTRTAAKSLCRVACEHELEAWGSTGLTRNLRADAFACMTDYQDRWLTCEDPSAWRQSEISARKDSFDYALTEYPYLVKLTAREIVDKVFRVAEQGFVAQGLCASQGQSITLLYTTALAINRVRAAGVGFVKWEEAQALSLEWLRAWRGY